MFLFQPLSYQNLTQCLSLVGTHRIFGEGNKSCWIKTDADWNVYLTCSHCIALFENRLNRDNSASIWQRITTTQKSLYYLVKKYVVSNFEVSSPNSFSFTYAPTRGWLSCSNFEYIIQSGCFYMRNKCHILLNIALWWKYKINLSWSTIIIVDKAESPYNKQ